MISNQKKKFWFLYFLMLALELFVAWFILSTHGFNFYQGGDSPGYMFLAKNLVEHRILSLGGDPLIPTNFRTPGYPLFLALIYLIFHSFIPAIFLGALISAFAAPLIYLIAREIFSEKLALTSGILTAIEPMNLFLGVSILTEGIFTPVLFLFIFYFVKYINLNKVSYLWYSSVLLGISTLIRPIMFYFWPLVVVFIICKIGLLNWRLAFKNSVIFIIIFFAILGPWLIRNKISVNSWQITGLQGYIFFVDHYGAVLRYLGEAGPLSDVQAKANIIAGDKIFTLGGSDELFRIAINGIKNHKVIYANVYVKSLISFFIANGYKSLFIDILGIPAKAPYIPFELFLRFDFKSIFKTFADMDFAGFLIYWGSKVFWIAVFISFLSSLIYTLFKKEYQEVKIMPLFIAAAIFYFAIITGPTAIGGGRTKAPINGLIFIFAAFGFAKLYEFLFKKTA